MLACVQVQSMHQPACCTAAGWWGTGRAQACLPGTPFWQLGHLWLLHVPAFLCAGGVLGALCCLQ
jgi:hypothetical protein